MSLTVKAFMLKKGSSDPEIRRVAIPADVTTSYDYLFKKLSDIFAPLRSGKFSLYWKDSEGDFVSFSTDEELLEALGYIDDNVFRVYIKEKMQESSNGDAQNKGMIHPGVSCDGCGENVYGVRHKCLVCLNYDLCSPCEKKGTHTEHDMTKITPPFDFLGMLGRLGKTGCPRGRGRGGCGQGASPRPNSPPKDNSEDLSTDGEPGGYYGMAGQQWPFVPPPQLCKWMNSFMKGMKTRKNNDNGCSGVDGEEKPSSSKSDDHKQGEETSDEFLRTIGEQVAAMLDPLGIDVSVNVDTDEKDTESSYCSKGGNETCRQQHRERDQSPVKKTPTETLTAKTQKDTDERPVDNTSPYSSLGETQRKSFSDWTLLNTPNAGQTEMPPSSQATAGPQVPLVYPTIPTAPREPTSIPNYPQDPRLFAALQHMLAMGFSNEGGWLSRLIEAKKGDIDQVLETIQKGRSAASSHGYMA